MSVSLRSWRAVKVALMLGPAFLAGCYVVPVVPAPYPGYPGYRPYQQPRPHHRPPPPYRYRGALPAAPDGAVASGRLDDREDGEGTIALRVSGAPSVGSTASSMRTLPLSSVP